MTPEEFSKGTLIYEACCGQKLDKEYLRVWWEMLKAMDAKTYHGAVLLFVAEEKSPARLNFVASVIDYAKIWDRDNRKKLRLEAENLKKIGDGEDDLMPPEEIKKLLGTMLETMGKGK
tara:strand:+ start:5706 stop:6059 length:354 start_codon:yes stop_codon:yes gene_type:complete